MFTLKPILSTIGAVALLCLFGPLCLGAASAAPALQLHECINTGGSGIGTHQTQWRNSACVGLPFPPGEWETTKIITRNNILKWTGTTPLTLESTVGGTSFKISCTVEGTGEGENVEEHAVGSEIVTELSCTVLKPASERCAVASSVTTNKLMFETGETSVRYSPSGVTPIAVFTVTQGPGPTCPAALLGSHNLTGTAVAVLGSETTTTQEFTETSGSELEYGGHAATLRGAVHSTTTGGQIVAWEKP